MKASELRVKNKEELEKELRELLKARISLSMQMATQQSTNTSEIKKVRRDIARVRTVIKEKESIE
ncbi:MAG: 50S ribosomal protein L29 [Proteobacteria bacterium]|nr:50S ribosomal protein L29 [Pseudomonadota bacterium]|tara:strand:+ start:603 stop:797 length:195 start_codon:yes stop_codon:yes gene_type:complete